MYVLLNIDYYCQFLISLQWLTHLKS